jgi:hypothetical protein
MTPFIPDFAFGPATPTSTVAGILARGGLTMSELRGFIDADLAAMTDDAVFAPKVVLVNATVNSIGAVGLQWQTDLAYIVDAMHTKYPSALVYIAKPWRQGYDAQCDTLAGYIDTIIAARAGWAFAGHDERVWLKGADDGATMTYDGIHYTAVGNTEAASQWQTALGY